MSSKIIFLLSIVLTFAIFLTIVFISSTLRQTKNISPPRQWDDVTFALKDAISQSIFPGAAALVLNSSHIMYESYLGRQTYNESSSGINNFTLWDMASCTKVLATTTAIMMMSERVDGLIDKRISDIFPEFGTHGKTAITVRHCLLHNAGFPPDPIPNYWALEFNCPETVKSYPELSFNCMKKIRTSWANTKLQNEIGSTFLYSDLSFMTLSYVVGHFSRSLNLVSTADLLPGCPVEDETCFYEAFVRLYIIQALGLKNMRFLPKNPNRCPPAWFDQTYRKRVIKGEVSDGNAFANGGIFGHAGIFSNALDAGNLAREILFNHRIVKRSTAELFVKVFDSNFSSRAMGWDTNIYKNSTCAALSPSTFLHTGYSGTLVCCDPERNIITVLLTNRVYPDDSHSDEIQNTRVKFNQLVKEVLDGDKQGRC